MSLFDSLINGMQFGAGRDDIDDENYDGDEAFEDEDEIAPPRRKPSFTNRGRSSKNSSNDPDDDIDTRLPIVSAGHSVAKNSAVCIIKATSFDQTEQIADVLLSGRTVFLNLEGLDVNTAQRIIDFASGACYALHGTFAKTSQFTFVIAPQQTPVEGNSEENVDPSSALGVPGALSQTGGFATSVNPFTQNLSNPYQREG